MQNVKERQTSKTSTKKKFMTEKKKKNRLG